MPVQRKNIQQTKQIIDRSVDYLYYRKSTKHALFRLIQSWQKDLNESGLVGTKPMELSKVFYCLPHDLMVAKLEACGLAKES